MCWDDVKELPYLLMILKLWPVDLEDQPDQTSKNIDGDNERGDTQENG